MDRSLKDKVVVPAHSKNSLILALTIFGGVKCVTKRWVDILMMVQKRKQLHSDVCKNKTKIS